MRPRSALPTTGYVTEEVAKTRWCPQARSYIELRGQPPIAVNREADGRPDIGAHCLASGCMFWRFEQAAETETVDERLLTFHEILDLGVEALEGYRVDYAEETYAADDGERMKALRGCLVAYNIGGDPWREIRLPLYRERERPATGFCGLAGAPAF